MAAFYTRRNRGVTGRVNGAETFVAAVTTPDGRVEPLGEFTNSLQAIAAVDNRVAWLTTDDEEHSHRAA